MTSGARRWSRRTFLGGMAGLAGCAQVVPTPAPATGRLQVVGNTLSYQGAPVRLRGVAAGDVLGARADRPVSDYQVLAQQWRCNLVRIAMHPSYWRHQQGKAMALLERDVAAALANRLFVVLDWHAIGWPDGWFLVPNRAWGAPPDLYDSGWNLALSFWRAAAERFGSDGRIAFELWNEPVRGPGDLDDPPGAYWPALKARYGELLAVIRRRSGNLVLLAGDRWAHDLRGVRADPVDDPNAAYAWHVYANHDGDDATSWAEHLDELDRAHPVVVTEWGFCRTCANTSYQGTPQGFGQRFTREFLNGRGMPWTAWCWHPAWGPAMLEDDWTTPSEFGRFVRAELAQGRQVPA
jgi:hypothetical protein